MKYIYIYIYVYILTYVYFDILCLVNVTIFEHFNVILPAQCGRFLQPHGSHEDNMSEPIRPIPSVT
jgi:hypothetical protein